MERFTHFILNYKTIIFLYFALSVFASTQSLLLKEKSLHTNGPKYKAYNNYLIFKQSFHHLEEKKYLYVSYPKEQGDLFKYSPTFAFFFGIFAFLPDWIGLNLWNLLNAFVFLFSIYYLPQLSIKNKSLLLLICLPDLTGSMQNSQSNALIAGLLILIFGLLEKEHYLMASFCLVFSIFIKIFGIVGLVLFLFYPKKWKSAIYIILWSIVLLLIPLVSTDVHQLKLSYYSWKFLLASDHSISYGISAMGLLNSWFHFNVNKNVILLVGMLLFCIPLIKIKEYKNILYRFLILSSVLLWIIIFNHKAESPSFIIAMAGVTLWYFVTERTALTTSLLIFAFILTSLSATDLVPKIIWDEFIKPYNLKVLPCIIIWLKISYDLIKLRTIKENLT